MTKEQILQAFKERTENIEFLHGVPVSLPVEKKEELEQWLEESLSLFEKAIREETLQKLKIPLIDEEFGIGYVTINRNKYLVEAHSKEFRMIQDLATEQNKKIDKLIGNKKA